MSLQAIVDEELLIYQAFQHTSGTEGDHLKVRFKKVSHDILMREKKKRAKKGTKMETDELTERSYRIKRLRPFNDVSSYSGVSHK